MSNEHTEQPATFTREALTAMLKDEWLWAVHDSDFRVIKSMAAQLNIDMEDVYPTSKGNN